MRFNSLLTRKGSLLIEALLIVVIMSVCLTLIIHSFISSARVMRYNSDFLKARLLLGNAMNQIVQQGLLQQPLTADNLKDDEGIYKYVLEEHSVGEDPDSLLKELALTISWPSRRNKEREISLATYFRLQPEEK